MKAAVSRKLTNDGADEGTEDDTRKTKEQADNGADQRADHGAFGRAESLGAEHSRPEIDGIGKDRENGQDNQGADAHVSKIFSPRGDKKPGKNQG